MTQHIAHHAKHGAREYMYNTAKLFVVSIRNWGDTAMLFDTSERMCYSRVMGRFAKSLDRGIPYAKNAQTANAICLFQLQFCFTQLVRSLSQL